MVSTHLKRGKSEKVKEPTRPDQPLVELANIEVAEIPFGQIWNGAVDFWTVCSFIYGCISFPSSAMKHPRISFLKRMIRGATLTVWGHCLVTSMLCLTFWQNGILVCIMALLWLNPASPNSDNRTWDPSIVRGYRGPFTNCLNRYISDKIHWEAWFVWFAWFA